MGPAEPSSIQAGSRVALRCWWWARTAGRSSPGASRLGRAGVVPAGPGVSEGRRLGCGRGALVEIRVAPWDRLRGDEDVADRLRVGVG
jgi:hypothetical protein